MINRQPDRSIKYILYARKSTTTDERQSSSLQDQQKEMEQIAQNLNLNVVHTISESKSAKSPGRPGFDDMVKRIEDGEADGILVWAISRLARNPIDAGRIMWLLQTGAIKHIKTFSGDYTPEDNAIVSAFEFAVSNQYIINLSWGVKRGMRQKALRGWLPMNVLPLGYAHKEVEGQSTKIITTDPDRFYSLKKLWKLALTGDYSISDLKRKGDELELRGSSGKLISKSTYYYMFRNEFYCGYFWWVNQEGDRIRIKGKHTPMVTEKEFMEIQRKLRITSDGTVRPKKYTYPFKQDLSCGECGSSVTAQQKAVCKCSNCKSRFSAVHKNECPNCGLAIENMKPLQLWKVIYYNCTKRRGPCSQKPARKESIVSAINKGSEEAFISKRLYSFMQDCVKGHKSANPNDYENAHNSLMKLKTRLTKKLDNLIDMRANGEIGRENFETRKVDTQKEIERIERKIAGLEDLYVDWKDIFLSQCQLAAEAKKVLESDNDEDKSMMLKRFCSNPVIIDKKLIFTTPKAFSYAKIRFNKWISEFPVFEPDSDVENKGDFENFEPPKSLISSVYRTLDEVRTLIIQEELEKRRLDDKK